MRLYDFTERERGALTVSPKKESPFAPMFRAIAFGILRTKILPFEGRWPLKGVGGVIPSPEGMPKFGTFPVRLTPLRRARARHLPSKRRI
jgi:hypothetical protein